MPVVKGNVRRITKKVIVGSESYAMVMISHRQNKVCKPLSQRPDLKKKGISPKCQGRIALAKWKLVQESASKNLK